MIADQLEDRTKTLQAEIETFLETIADESNFSFGDVRRDADGCWIVGFEDGVLEYVYRKFRPEDARRGETENEYLYGKYGWKEYRELVEEARMLADVAEDTDTAEESAIEDLRSAIVEYESAVYGVRREVTLEDIAQIIEAHDFSELKRLVATDDDDVGNLWQLLFSKDDNGARIDNDIRVPLVSESFMLTIGTRYYEGDEYPVAFVIGIDDTQERFFVHRLDRDSDIDNRDFEWTPEDVRQKMGFDVDLNNISGELPLGERVRLQGDLAVVRHDYKTVYWKRFEERYNSELPSEVYSTLRGIEKRPDFAESADVRVNRRGLFVTVSEDTERLKETQEKLEIPEEAVRERQEKYGYSRLTAGRRSEIVQELIQERLVDWTEGETEFTRTDVEAEAESWVSEMFEDTSYQYQVIGNHIVMMDNAADVPRFDVSDRDSLQAFSVPDETTLVVGHDEHENKKLILTEGVYEFRFLDGFEDQPWMSR